MATDYPTAVDGSDTLPNPGSTSDTNSPSLAGGQTNQNDAIKAVETKLGTGNSTAAASTVLTGSGSGTSAWGKVALASMVSGSLPVLNGGTGSTTASAARTALGAAASGNNSDITQLSGLSAATGTGNVVLASSPTIVTPTIASLTNAQHTHANAAGGGTLNAANALQAGSVNFANLLTTIFSGQVQTFSQTGNAGGTQKYLNLGGIKLFWGQSAGISGTNANYTFNLPTSFFATIDSVTTTMNSENTTPNQAAGTTGQSTSSIVVAFFTANSVSAGDIISILVIGS